MPRSIELDDLATWIETGADPRTGLVVRVWPFGDGPELSAELLELVLARRKTATADMLWLYECEGEPVPRPGQLSVVTTWDGEPRAVIETTSVEIVPFDQVEAAFARHEGEGDLTLGHWRRVHREYYARECARIGRPPDDDMPIVCERFRLLREIRPGEPGVDRLRRR